MACKSLNQLPVSNALSLHAIRVERASERFRHLDRLAAVPAEGDDGQRPFRSHFPILRAHGEGELNGAAADTADADLGLELLVESRRAAQIEVELHPRQPEVQRLP